MSPLIARAVILAATVAMIAIRAPHGQRSRSVAVEKSFRGRKETIALVFAMVGFFIPLVWLVSPLLSFADYPLHPAALTAGVVTFVYGLWLFHRSHADLGTNWSVTLEVREGHRLVTNGVYRRIRHPMYSALFIYSLAQTVALPNWVAGPSYLLTFGLLYLLRIDAEERMMSEKFGAEYQDYVARTKRLVPGVV